MLDFRRGIVHWGDPGPVRAVLDRAAAGERVTLGFIGGSITQGSLASAPENGYAGLVSQWFCDRFPQTVSINAGIGGTTSQFGAVRVEEDLLRFHPDLTVIEFSVNDSDTPLFQETYEALVRRVLLSGSAVILLHNICYDSGLGAEPIHSAVGRHYGLPCVSIRPTLYQAILDGHIPARDITPDDLHPNDAGHKLLAQGVICLLEQIRALAHVPSVPKALPAPLTDNAWQLGKRYQNHNSSPICQGFRPDDTPQTHITQMFRRGFTADRAGQKITFHVEGSEIAVQYRKSVKRPAPIAQAILDDDRENPVILDANFQEDWGDCLCIQDLLVHGENRLHKVEITITEAHSQDAVPFYLTGILASGRSA